MAFRLYTINLLRSESSIPWGFRLEGGTDVGHPLNIQKVSPDSIAEKLGLTAGDHILQINQSDTQYMRHEDAKMEIIRSGNDIRMVVKHSVTGRAPVISPQAYQSQQDIPTPLGSVLVATQASPGPRTNLKTDSTAQNRPVAATLNVTPVPFAGDSLIPGQSLVAQTNDGRVQRVVHSEYNTPMGLYSKKNLQSSLKNAMNVAGVNPNSATPMGEIPRNMLCGLCGNYIRGVFVKIQGRIPMHPECLKCSKCGIGLRNVGYFYINDVLYCETHAKLAAQPPQPGMKPVLVYK